MYVSHNTRTHTIPKLVFSTHLRGFKGLYYHRNMHTSCGPLARKVYDIDLAAWCGLWLHVHVHVYEAEAYYHEYYVAGSRSAFSS